MILSEYSGAYTAYSLRRLNNTNEPYPLVRVSREEESYSVECDVLADSNQIISFDSPVITGQDSSALTLGEFLHIQGYDNPDSLPEASNAKIVKLYDQANDNDFTINSTNEAFLLVENSTILTINNKPAFRVNLITDISNAFSITAETDLSLHYVAQKVNDDSYLGFKVTTDILAALTDSKSFTVNFPGLEVNLISKGLEEVDLGTYNFDTNIEDTSLFTVEFNKSSTSTVLQFADTALFSEVILYPNYSNQRRHYIENDQAEYYSLTAVDNLLDTITPNSFINTFGTPAAAYSVRSLRGLTGLNGPKVLRVRREVDNAEVDVYTDSTGWVSLDSPVEIVPAITGNLEGGTGDEIDSLAVTLGEFVNDPDHGDPDGLISATTAKVVVWYDQSDPDYLVDNLPESIQERGAPIRIRVIGGTYNNYEFDVYFDNNETISLSSYVADTYEITDSNGQVTAAISSGTLQTLLDAGMTEAAVCVWYDQSGSGNDASQDVSTAQPKIISERTNLFTYSNQFDSVAWDTNTNGVTRTASSITDPDGGTNAWEITTTATTEHHRIGHAITAGAIKTVSFYAKANGYEYVRVWSFSGGNTNSNYFHLSGEGTAVVSIGQYGIVSIESVGNGWYRCQAVLDPLNGSAVTISPVPDALTASSTSTYLADGTSGIYLYNAQLEAGSSATAYIETTTSAVTVSGVVTKNGKPAVQFDGSSDHMDMNHTDLYGQSRLDSFIHYQSSDDAFILYHDDTGGGGLYSFIPLIGSTATGLVGTYGSPDLYINGAQVNVVYGTTTRGNLHTAIVTNGVSATAGALETHLNSSTASWNAFGISPYNNIRLNGKICEMVFYNTDQSSNRTGIESNINTYYSIYTP